MNQTNYDELLPLLQHQEFDSLQNFILMHANLPSQMANLTLVSKIADFVSENEALGTLWYSTFDGWFKLEANGNDPQTVLVMTALESFGAMYPHSSKKQQVVIESYLISALNDSRWRIREIVTESFKRIAVSSYTDLEILFNDILNSHLTPLEMRGILATVAHPNLLVTKKQLAYAQKIMEQAFDYYTHYDSEQFSKEDKTILKKGLSFAPSVIVAKNPPPGFNLFEKLIREDNKGIKIIIKANLKKKRLENSYPDDVQLLLNQL